MLEAPKGETPEDWEPVELTLFRSTQFGDDQDRPMKKSDGSWTYFGADAAYHLQKAEKADHLVNIWGADHAGTVKRIQAAVDGADRRPRRSGRQDRPDGPAVARRRAGQDVEAVRQFRDPGRRGERSRQGRGALHDADQARRTRLLDFDFAKVVEASKDNPVFYVQYAHARISSLQRKAEDGGVSLDAKADLTCSMRTTFRWSSWPRNIPRVVEAAAMAHEPHRIAFYLYDLAAALHAHWNSGNDDTDRRFLIESKPELTRARLELARGIGQVIKNGLGLMGVEAAEEMR